MAPIHYHELAPHPDLAGHVLNYWEFAASDSLREPYAHHVVPDGCVSLIHVRPPADGASQLLVMGPRMSELQTTIPPGMRYFGVRVWPGAATALLRLEPLALRDQVVPAHLHLPALAKDLLAGLHDVRTGAAAARVFDAALLPMRAAAQPVDRFVAAGVAAITASQGQVAMGDIARRLGIGERQFQRLFRAAVGLTPKQFARIRRFRTAMMHAIEPSRTDWRSVAYEHGFADQAHLVREFSQLAGLSPTTFRERIGAIEHGPVSP